MRGWLLIFATLCFVTPALSHDRSQSFSNWVVTKNKIEGVFTVDAFRATQLSQKPVDLVGLMGDHLKENITLVQEQITCKVGEPLPLWATQGELRFEIKVVCPKTFSKAQAKLHMGAFFNVSNSHVHYLRVSLEGDESREFALTASNNKIVIANDATNRPNGIVEFAQIGVSHVLSGFDHLAFLAALLLFAGSFRGVVLAITGFTLGHSLTLALVSLQVLKPDNLAIEALIGFTIAWAAAEALRRHSHLSKWYGAVLAFCTLSLLLFSSLMWQVLFGCAIFVLAMAHLPAKKTGVMSVVVAALFGLVHGAGFAGPLVEMNMEGKNLLFPLLGFNLGVEAGQLLAVVPMLLVAYLVARKVKIRLLAFEAASCAVFALGVFWFVSRAIA